MDDLTAEAIKRLIGAGIGAAGLGVVTRGALGGLRSLSTPAQEPSIQQRIVVPLPIAKQKNVPKRTYFGAGGPSSMGMGELTGLPGESKTAEMTVSDMPGYLPALAAVTLPAAYLGYKGMDSYLNNRERTGMKDQLDAARKRFRTSLVESLGPVPMQPKLAIDQLTVNRTKIASSMLGMLGAGGVVAGLLSAKLMYDAASSRSPSAVLASAEKRRQRETAARTPPSIELQPTPVSVGRSGSVHVLNPDVLGNETSM